MKKKIKVIRYHLTTNTMDNLISFNEAIIHAKKITHKDKACIGGYHGVYIDGEFYVSTFQFKSNRSKCYNRLVNYLQENQIPHGIEKLHLGWGEVESKEIHISIFKYNIEEEKEEVHHQVREQPPNATQPPNA